MNSPQGAGGKKNTDAEISAGVWSDSIKAEGADVKMLYTDAVGGTPNANSVAQKIADLITRLGTIDTATTDSLHGKIGTDTEMADISLYDMIGYEGAASLASKLAGEATTNSTVSKNWSTVNDSPDSVGGLVVTLGTAATKKKLHSLLLDVSALTDGAIIHVKLFQKINDNANVKVYDEIFTIGTDPDGLWIINGTLVIHDHLRVAVKSDTAESVAIEYTVVTVVTERM